jgi:beta-galactosidase
MKDQYDSLNPQRQPGPLVPELGGRVEQYYALEKPVAVQFENPGQSTSKDCVPMSDAAPGSCVTLQQLQERQHPTHGNAGIWAEMLSTSSADTHVILRYGHDAGWLADKPAMIERAIGTGSIAYLGTLPEARLMSTLLNDAAREAHVVSSEGAQNAVGANVEICERVNNAGRRVVIVINHNDGGKWITLGGHLRNLLPGIDVTYTNDAHSQAISQFTIPSQGVAVMVPEQAP